MNEVLERVPKAASLRPTGIDVIGAVPWGTHFCQFYKTPQDLVDVLVPYFKAGLESNEYCMWVTSEPLTVPAAGAALRRVMPEFDRYAVAGAIEIMPHTDWYLRDGAFDAERVLAGWVQRHDDALAKGFAGLRLTGNTFWLEPAQWHGFFDYEAAVDRVIGNYRMIALCTYSLEKCGAAEILDVVQNHRFALMKREGRWTTIKAAPAPAGGRHEHAG